MFSCRYGTCLTSRCYISLLIERYPQEEVVESVQIVVVGWDVLRDLDVDEILSEVEHHMEGLTNGIDETVVDQLPL